VFPTWRALEAPKLGFSFICCGLMYMLVVVFLSGFLGFCELVIGCNDVYFLVFHACQEIGWEDHLQSDL